MIATPAATVIGHRTRAPRPGLRRCLLAAQILWLAGCAPPERIEVPAEPGPAQLAGDRAVMPDGARLPVRIWGQPEDAETVALGLHGFNDYSNAFAPLAEHLAAEGIATYAVDQRGFGAATGAGRWHGSARLVADAQALLDALRRRHPDARLILIGESMGAAVALLAANRPLTADGLVLIAPAVWSRATMPWLQRVALAAAVRFAPGLRLTGDGVPIHPSDNREMLRAMGRDPLVVKETRIDALWGVTNLMDHAAAQPLPRTLPVLILYGEKDRIIPRPAFCRFATGLPRAAEIRLVLYRQGWHMLPRDQQGARVRRDIAAWINDPQQPLPSGEEIGAGDDRLQRLCRGKS